MRKREIGSLDHGDQRCGVRQPTSSHCAPTVCIQVPMLLASTASHSILNTRCWSGAQGDVVEGAVTALLMMRLDKPEPLIYPPGDLGQNIGAVGVLELVHFFDTYPDGTAEHG